MISSKEVLNCAETIAQFCKEQRGCQNCIFRQFGADHWDCHVDAFDIREVLDNIEAKKKNYGYL